MVIVIGRGHSGTRAIAETLARSGVALGTVNESYDTLPPALMYEAAWCASKYVDWQGALSWSFDRLLDAEPTVPWNIWTDLYTETLMELPAEHRGWKLPETLLSLPWIIKKWPEAHYVYWVRDPRDVILGSHVTDDLRDFGIGYPATDDLLMRRAISWLYQYELVKATPKPERWHQVRLEDFVQHQGLELCRLAAFLDGLPLVTVPVKAEVVGRWREEIDFPVFSWLEGPLMELGYLEGVSDGPKDEGGDRVQPQRAAECMRGRGGGCAAV